MSPQHFTSMSPKDPVAEAWVLLELSRLQLAEDPGQAGQDPSLVGWLVSMCFFFVSIKKPMIRRFEKGIIGVVLLVSIFVH